MIKLTLIRSNDDEVEWWLKPAHISDIIAHQGGSEIFTIFGGLNQSCIVTEKPAEVIKIIHSYNQVGIISNFLSEGNEGIEDYKSVAGRDV